MSQKKKEHRGSQGKSEAIVTIVGAINLQQKILEVYPLADFIYISPLSACIQEE